MLSNQTSRPNHSNMCECVTKFNILNITRCKRRLTPSPLSFSFTPPECLRSHTRTLRPSENHHAPLSVCSCTSGNRSASWAACSLFSVTFLFIYFLLPPTTKWIPEKRRNISPSTLLPPRLTQVRHGYFMCTYVPFGFHPSGWVSSVRLRTETITSGRPEETDQSTLRLRSLCIPALFMYYYAWYLKKHII